jgi:hypothetical protein
MTPFSTVTVIDRNLWNQTYEESANTNVPPIDPNLTFTQYLGLYSFQTTGVYYFNGGQQFPPGRYRIVASGAYNNAVVMYPYTPWEIGAKAAYQNYGNLGMSVHYGSLSNTVSNLVVSGNVLEFNHPGGQIGVWNYDVGLLSDNYGDATYVLSYVHEFDTDGDGIVDSVETNGFFDGNGNQYITDPNNPDSDGDGISDGEEAGQFFIIDGKRYYKLNSDPMKADSDGDGLSDLDEYDRGSFPMKPDSDNDGLNDNAEVSANTDPMNSDSDADGLADGIDPNPRDPSVNDLTDEQKSAEFILGFTNGGFSSNDLIHDNDYFLAGHALSGYLGFGDVRDIGSGMYHHNGEEAMWAAVGIIPLYGDEARILGKFEKICVEKPEKAAKYLRFILKAKAVDDEVNAVRVLRPSQYQRAVDSGIPHESIVLLSKEKGDALSEAPDFIEHPWSSGEFKKYVGHYNKHNMNDFDGYFSSPQDYATTATNLLNTKVGVEIFYDARECNYAVRNPSNDWFAAGEIGKITTFFKRNDEAMQEIGRWIRLN